MEFRIAETFTDSLARLTSDEQKAAKTTAFDLQLNPVNPGMQFHKLAKAKDKNFWSVRVNRDVRLIVHKTSSSLLLCYVDHHDDAYRWAERRRLETHPKTGAAQFVVIRETVIEQVVRKAVDAASARPKLFENVSDTQLLGYGVPPEWLADVKGATEDTLLDIAALLPAEAAESLLQLATGGMGSAQRAIPSAPTFDHAGLALESLDVHLSEETQPSLELPVPAALHPGTSEAAAEATAFSHPDAQRRFRLIENREELERALEYPWDKWTTFLHPAQRDVVERNYSGPARVSGSAGTGKTIVALHRAVSLARKNRDARVLLTTFSDSLAHALRTKLRRLIGNEPRLGERIDVHSLDSVGLRLYKALVGPVSLADRKALIECIEHASRSVGAHKFSQRFLLAEWEQVVDAWQLFTWEEYRDVARLGRKTRLSEANRRLLWSIFERVRADLASRKLITGAALFVGLAEVLRASGAGVPGRGVRGIF